MAIDLSLLRCFVCEARLALTAPSLGDPVWRLYCTTCDSTLCLPVRRYTSVTQVCALFSQLRLPFTTASS
jgi:hypothetical protein